jgi:hypothetical protein
LVCPLPAGLLHRYVGSSILKTHEFTSAAVRPPIVRCRNLGAGYGQGLYMLMTFWELLQVPSSSLLERLEWNRSYSRHWCSPIMLEPAVNKDSDRQPCRVIGKGNGFSADSGLTLAPII